MLSALFSISKDFIISIVQKIESLRDHLPIFGVFWLSFKSFFRNKSSKKIWFFLAPIIGGQVDFFETEPLKHARFAWDSWNDWGYSFPIFSILNKGIFTSSFYISSNPFLSAYFEMTQMRIWTSYSLQFFFILLFLIILGRKRGTFRFWGSSFWVQTHRSCRLNKLSTFWNFARNGKEYPPLFHCSEGLPDRLRSHNNDLWHCTTPENVHVSSSYSLERNAKRKRIPIRLLRARIGCYGSV